MGLCVHLRHQQTCVEYALKTIRPDLVGKNDAQQRFFDELQVWLSASACSLVVEAFAVTRIGNSAIVIAPWMEGGDLSTRMGRMQAATKLETLLRIVRALQWAKENLSIIHRDLKPQNVLLDADSRAYVADWGLARPVRAMMRSVADFREQATLDRPDRTDTGGFVGTLLYAAPEQIRGVELIDHRADIYALGCIMFEMETGRPPFVAATPEAIAAMHLSAKPPSVGGLLNRGTLGLAKTISLCLAKEPRDRVQDYTELEAALLKAMAERGGDVTHCAVDIRYERSVLGQGHLGQSTIIDRAVVAGKSGMAVVERDDIFKYWKEAENLIAVGRYREATRILEPYVIREPLLAVSAWFDHHSVALNYAYCLRNL